MGKPKEKSSETPKKLLPSSSNCKCIHDVSMQDSCKICDDHFQSIKDGFDNLKVKTKEIIPKEANKSKDLKTNKTKDSSENETDTVVDDIAVSNKTPKEKEIEIGINDNLRT